MIYLWATTLLQTAFMFSINTCWKGYCWVVCFPAIQDLLPLPANALQRVQTQIWASPPNVPLEVSSCYCYFWNSDFLQKPRTKTPEAPVMGISQTYGRRALQAMLSDTFANLQLLQHQVWVRYVSSWCDIWLNFTCLHLQASEILWNHQHPALCKLIGLLLASKIPHLPA